ncbi:MAG: hypothetical protein H0T76_04260 [Nannocystis sp.]|nr:hypothetical protein [Nannocystis sp.]MBA3545675.1 hypothetical protein [Nannocystis sp.]
MAPRSLVVAASLVGLACNGPGATTTSFTTAPVVTTRPDDTTSGSTSASGGSSSTSGSSTGSGSAESNSGTSTTDAAFPDMGMQPDFGGSLMGCKGKIDFLFVISRTGVMWESQENFVKAFPKFIDAIRAQFDDFDVHIMVVDSSQEWTVNECDKQCNGPCDIAPGYPCKYFPSACDETMGAGTVYNAGPYTENVPCGLDEHRYMTAEDLDTPGLFECLARVGTAGVNMMGDALVAAVSPELNGPGGCNEGFIRPNALLVLTMIGPEDSAVDVANSKGTWQQWRQAVVDAKGGDESAIVALGIISGDDCLPNTNPNIRLCELIPSFPNSLLEHLTLDDYGPAFNETAKMAIDACSLFIPG